jgi:hypothetical protein
MVDILLFTGTKLVINHEITKKNVDFYCKNNTF